MGIAYCSEDVISRSAWAAIDSRGFSDCELNGRMLRCMPGVGTARSDVELLCASDMDSIGFSSLCLLSQHKSSAGKTSFTVHAAGNWGDDTRLGGSPRSLSRSDPVLMHSVLASMKRNAAGVNCTYEATHHGPLLQTPSFFAEFGGSDLDIKNEGMGALLGKCVLDGMLDVMEGRHAWDRIAIGIGSQHYPDKFTDIAMRRGVAFAHIMPGYAITADDDYACLDMLERAAAMSSIGVELAFIEWKGINSEARNRVVAKLGQMGLDYERA